MRRSRPALLPSSLLLRSARVSRFAFITSLCAVMAFALWAPMRAEASNVQFVGSVAYVHIGQLAVLTADKVENFDASGVSGTLRMELWALAAPYTGGAFSGYRLAVYSLGQLNAGYYFADLNSGEIPYGAPPNGTYTYVMFLTEFTGASFDDGYVVRNWLNTLPTVVVGPPPFSPQVGLWWNPNESGSGYALDFKHGVLVVTVYSYAPTGAAQWYIASGPVNGSTFTGTLIKAVNGQCISCAYQVPVSNGNDGTMTIVFSSPTSATMSLPGGRVIPIQPQAF